MGQDVSCCKKFCCKCGFPNLANGTASQLIFFKSLKENKEKTTLK